MDQVTIRSATPADASQVAKYHRRCVVDTFSAQLRADSIVVPAMELIEAQLYEWFQLGSSFDTTVAELDTVPIGHVTVNDNRLIHLFVDPHHQGSGLGTRLLAVGEAKLTAAGHATAELHARVENVRALAFYQHAGWTATNELARTTDLGITYDERVLVKALAPN